jgi:hypothetical protein
MADVSLYLWDKTKSYDEFCAKLKETEAVKKIKR